MFCRAWQWRSRRLSRIASDAVNYFRRGTVMQSGGVNVNVYRQPYRSQAIKDEPWMMMAISIPYQCYARQPDQWEIIMSRVIPRCRVQDLYRRRSF